MSLDTDKTRQEELERAYGGCHKCYGKGYATYINGTTAYADFGDEFGGIPSVHSDKLEMRFCSCDRGKQLDKLVNQQVLAALDKVKSTAVENVNGVMVVGVHSIEEIEKEYKV